LLILVHWQVHDLRCVLKRGRNSKTPSGHRHDNVRGHYHVNDWKISLTQTNAWHMTMTTPTKTSNWELIWNNLYLSYELLQLCDRDIALVNVLRWAKLFRKSYFLQWNRNNSYLCIGIYRDLQTALGTVVFTSTLIMPSPAVQSLSLFLSIPLSLVQSINHDNALYIGNYYIIITWHFSYHTLYQPRALQTFS
jgi:hypothetical protein